MIGNSLLISPVL